MSQVVQLDVARVERDGKLQALWSAYNAARAKAQSSGRIEDGIAAGKAWAAWLDAFRAVYP